MNYEEDYEDLSPEEQKKWDLTQKKKKQKQQMMIMALLLIGSGTFYLFSYLPDQRKDAKEQIEEVFRNSPTVQPEMLFTEENGKLINHLWPNCEKWEDYLNTLYLPSQLEAFVKKITSAIERKSQEIAEEERERPRKMREEVIERIKKSCLEEELNMPKFQEIIQNYTEKINETSSEELDNIEKEASDLIVQERIKRQRLHWRKKTHNWADRKLLEFTDVFDEAWTKKQQEGMNKATFSAPYTIYFPPSLWNELTEEQKNHEKATKLTLRSDVDSYKFNDKINDWYDKVESDPIRGEKDSETKKDNNALFYGTGGTGKSITAEKLAYKSDTHPLVIVKGLALTPKLPDQKCNIAVFEKFIFTMADITWTLIEDFSYERAEGGEASYIFFLDEADQISENSFTKESTGLTFLKECMGSDDYKKNESWNLWIMATNHLGKIDPAVYRPGRLSNPLDFSWTLGDFLRYAGDAGINNQFPQHWEDNKILNDEDNKWVNRFNKDHFDADFLPFWRKFIDHNPNAEYEPEKDEENNNNEEGNSNEEQKKIKIKWGEFFEFFWRTKDSNQLKSFDGKFTNPRNPPVEETIKRSSILVANQISKSVNIRLKELIETAENMKEEAQNSRSDCTSAITDGLEAIRNIVAQIR